MIEPRLSASCLTCCPGLRSGTGLLAVAAILAGCASEAPDGGRSTVRDSAGIRIIESAEPAWSAGNEWTVAAEPWLDIGLADGDPAYLFSRISGILELQSGEIVVAEGGSGEVRIFDREGGHVRSFGRTGEGPGEFRQLLDLLGRSGDTLFLNDSHQEIEAFGIDGSYRGTAPFEPYASYVVASPVGRFNDGSFIRATSPQGYPPPSGVQRWIDSTTLLRYDAMGGFVGEVARRPIMVFSVDPKAPGVYPDHLGPVGSVTASREHIYYSYPDDWNIEVRRPDGELVQLIRRAYTPVPVTAEYEEAARTILRRQLARTSHGMSPDYIESLIGRMRFAPTITAHTRMLIDAEGVLWVNESDPEAILAGTVPVTGAGDWWSVFAAQGEWLGRVRMPPGLQVYSIGSNSVAGTMRDDLDVEHVRLYRLTRGGR